MEKLSYISLINDFWHFYDEHNSNLNASDIVLYKVLLRYCNKIGWKNPFTINPYLMAEINPLSTNTYYKSFKNLNDLKLIKWVKGKHNVSNQQVTILKIKNSVKTSTNTSIENSIKFSVDTSTNTSLTNNNKTIIPLDNSTIRLLEKKDFDLIYSSKEFKKYLRDSGLSITKSETDLSIIDLTEIYLDLDQNGESETLAELTSEFLLYKKELKKPFKTKKSIIAHCNKLLKFSKKNTTTAREIYQTTYSNEWQGIFEPEEKRIAPNQKKHTINPDIQKDPNRMSFD